MPYNYPPAEVHKLFSVYYKDIKKTGDLENRFKATLLDLVTRGFISLKSEESGNIFKKTKVILTMTDNYLPIDDIETSKEDFGLTKYEKIIMNLLFKKISNGNDSVTTDDMKSYNKTNALEYVNQCKQFNNEVEQAVKSKT